MVIRVFYVQVIDVRDATGSLGFQADDAMNIVDVGGQE